VENGRYDSVILHMKKPVVSVENQNVIGGDPKEPAHTIDLRNLWIGMCQTRHSDEIHLSAD